MLKTRAGDIIGNGPKSHVPPTGLRILKRKAVTEKTGLERSAIYLQMQLDTFPKQVKMGPNAVGWIESEIDSWIADRVAERDSAFKGKGKR